MKTLKSAIAILALVIIGYLSYNQFYLNKKPKIVIGAREVISTPKEKGTIFISPNGTDKKECNFTNPCNLKNGIKKSKAGDIVFFRGGVYDISSLKNPQKRVKLNSGSKEKPIIYESYPNELAIFDGKNLKDNELGSIIVRDYTHLRKIEVRNMKKVGIKIRGDYNIIEGVNSHHNKSAGIHIYSKNGYRVNLEGGSHNIIKDCLVHHNSDIDTKYKGNNADGISISFGKDNLIAHTTVYSNSDDGIDTWKSINTTIEYSISYNNGEGAGDGNGFKLGGDNNKSSPLGVGTIAKYNIAYNNKNSGFAENSGRKILLKNNISYNNKNYGFIVFDKNSSVINNISYKNRKKEFYGNKHIAKNNSWQQKEPIKDSDFVSLNPNSIDFLKPKNNSHISKIGSFASIEVN